MAAITHCDELAGLLMELDAAERSAIRADRKDARLETELLVQELIERIRQHREQHADRDYKPTVQ